MPISGVISRSANPTFSGADLAGSAAEEAALMDAAKMTHSKQAKRLMANSQGSRIGPSYLWARLACHITGTGAINRLGRVVDRVRCAAPIRRAIGSDVGNCGALRAHPRDSERRSVSRALS